MVCLNTPERPPCPTHFFMNRTPDYPSLKNELQSRPGITNTERCELYWISLCFMYDDNDNKSVCARRIDDSIALLYVFVLLIIFIFNLFILALA